ncbi:MAG: hypothetical protein JNK72_04405, partial [Myxococcales bacterium]|nr:hypothetical protein [Myxococcales bacterium]
MALYVNDCPSAASGLPQGPLHWTSGWPTGTQIGLEAVLIHELGHAAFSIDDQIYQTSPQTPTYHGVMWGTYNSAQHGQGLNLYLVDQMTAIEGQADATGAPNGEGAGPTARHATVRTLDVSNQWVGPATNLPEPSTFGPGLASFRYPFEAHGYFAGHPNLIDFGLQLRRGAPASWIDYLGPYPNATGHGTVHHSWVSLATTPYGETAAAWLSCTGLPECRVIVATATSPTAELTSQMVGESSFARPEIAYDRWRDRFVLFFIHRDGTLRQSETTPWDASQWTYEQEVPTEEPGTLRFRYMGGLVFDYAQETASSLPHYYGSFFGARADVFPGNTLNAIVELSLGYDTTLHRYRLGQAELPIVGGDPHLFETV